MLHWVIIRLCSTGVWTACSLTNKGRRSFLVSGYTRPEWSREHSIIRGTAMCLRLFFFFHGLSAWNEAFWSELYGLNFISVSTEQCLLDWPVCFCSAARVKSVKWEIEKEGKSERTRGRKRKHKVTAIPQGNRLIKSDLHLKNRKQVKCEISKDPYESTEIVFKGDT